MQNIFFETEPNEKSASANLIEKAESLYLTFLGQLSVAGSFSIETFWL